MGVKRSKWKGPFLKKVNLTRNFANKFPRNYEITLKLVGLTCKVYSGQTFVKLKISNEMVGHKLGEFVPTRVKSSFKKKIIF